LRNVTLLLNESAGAAKDKSLREEILKSLGRNGTRVDLQTVNQGASISDITKLAVKNGAEVVIAGGGDGTVNAVASALIDSEAALGVLPLGTLNHFAKDLNIPLEPAGAAEIISTGVVRKVDVGEVNDAIFVNNSSLGLYPMVVRGRERDQRLGRSKWTALFWSTLAALRRYPILTMELSLADGKRFMRRTPLVFVGNNQYQIKGFEIGSRERLDGGALFVCVAPKDGAGSLLRISVAAICGIVRPGVDFDSLFTEKLLVDTPGRMIQVAIDGEVKNMVPPLLYRIRPSSLRVIAPPTR
jgi:diacylglycerol kinase family enzyme